MKYVFIILILFISFKTNASTKNEIIRKLENTNNMHFKFIQKINDKVEKGECKISYPKKILCKYDDIHKKILVSNGNSLVINSKKIKNYLRFKLEDTPLNLILDKSFMLYKLSQLNDVQENSETFFFELKHDETIVSLFFDKQNYNIIGWITLDAYQNKVETKLYDIKSNFMLDEKIFRIQRYFN